MKKMLLLLLAITLQTFALPRFALQQGDRCIDCHTNPTGGIVRDYNGWYFGKNLVSMISPRDKDVPMSPKISENISIGMDIRTQYLYSEELVKSDFQNMSGSVYATAKLSDKINVVGRYDFVSYTYEAYGVAHILPNNSYIKVGTFQPNYGIKIDDHTAYIKGGDHALLSQNSFARGLYFTPTYTETGIELGVYLSDFMFITASAAKGNDGYTFQKEPTYTTRVEFTPTYNKVGFLLGGSYAAHKTPGLNPQAADIYGFFGGVGYDKFAIMGEYDMGNNFDYTPLAELKSTFLMLKASYRIMLGLEVIARYDMIDPDKDTEKDELSRVIAGFEFFPYSFLEIRPQYRWQFEDAQTNNDAFVLQFHIWY